MNQPPTVTVTIRGKPETFTLEEARRVWQRLRRAIENAVKN